MSMHLSSEPRPMIGALAPFYRFTVPFSWFVVRVAVGLNLVVHGYPKIFRPLASMAPSYAEMGLEPAAFWAAASTWMEFGGGVAILLGLFTRFFAAGVAIEMAMISLFYTANGFAWLHRGYEYTLMWGLCSFAIALRGGGPYSVDRWLGREL